ncbi:MAG: FMN-binding protein [Deltaproteobacteria bacterium]|nr:FMN-binding protein [Deltaproteobacteria bacterium]
MIRTLVVTAMFSGLLIVGVYAYTKPIIKANREEQLRKAVFTVLPGVTKSQTFLVEGDKLVKAGQGETKGDRFHAGYDSSGKLVGVALEGAGMGYQDVIRVLYGYDPERRVIVGMMVLESKETPGLGDKIAKDPVFLANFEALDAKLGADGATLENTIVAVKKGAKKNAWEIDGITGATISSVAIAKLLAESANKRLKIVHGNLETLRSP